VNIFARKNPLDAYVRDVRRAAELQLRYAVTDNRVAEADMQCLLRDIERGGFTREQIEDGLIPDLLKRKIMELEAKHEQEKIAARAAATQAVLNAPHMQCSLSAAVNLWIVKFGDGWVSHLEVRQAVQSGEMDWGDLTARLADAGKIEKYEDFWRIIT